MDGRFDMLGFHDLKSRYTARPAVRERGIVDPDEESPCGLSPAERAVYRAFSALKGAKIHPETREIGRLTGLSRQTVEGCMQKLRCCGLIKDIRTAMGVASEAHKAEPDDPPEAVEIRAQAERMKVKPPPYPPSTWDDEQRFRHEFTRQMLADWGQFHERAIPAQDHEWRKRLILDDYRDL